MFEVACDNLDQYNPDQHTSASTDVVTSTSTKQPINDSTQTATPPHNAANPENNSITETDLRQKNKLLEQENKNLQGRIRGYMTLGSLLQDEKEANRKLSKDNEELKSKLTALDISSIQNCHDSDETHVESLRRNFIMKTHHSTAQSEPMESTDPPSPPPQSKEVIPMQESWHGNQNNLSALGANPSESIPGSAPSSQQNINIDVNLQQDSDRFDDPEYEKVGRVSSSFAQMGDTSSPVSDVSVTAQKYSFPNLHSVTSSPNQNTFGQSLGGNENFSVTSFAKPVMTVEGDATILSWSDSGSQLAAKLRELSHQVAKLDHDLFNYKKLNATLCEEIKKLKTSHQLELHEEKSKIYQLRLENTRLEVRIRDLDSGSRHMGDSLMSEQQWEKITKSEFGTKAETERFQESAALLPTEVSALTQMVHELQNKNKQLKDANNSWKNRWSQLESRMDLQIKSLENQLADKGRELNMTASREREFEQMLSAAKSHAGDEENAKEEALLQLHVANTRLEELLEKVAALEQDNKDLVRAKRTIEAELNVLKKEVAAPHGARPADTVDALKTEIAVLREQLTVFEEDFERERQDRAATQSAREEIQTKYEEVCRSREKLSQRLNNQQRKAEHFETELRKAQRRVQNLDTENKRLKMELQDLQQQAAVRYPPVSPLQPYTPQPYQPFPYGQHAYYQPGPITRQIPLGAGQMPLEHLPGAWTCSNCTYVNIPQRTVCEMCGVIRQKHTQTSQSAGNQEAALMSRGHNVPDNSSDLVTDNGEFK